MFALKTLTLIKYLNVALLSFENKQFIKIQTFFFWDMNEFLSLFWYLSNMFAYFQLLLINLYFQIDK